MNFRIQKPSFKIIGVIVGAIILLVGVILGVREVQRQQELRQRAQEAPGVCAVNQPTDTIILFDRSESMDQPTSSSDPTSRMTRAKQAATSFIDILDTQNTNGEHQAGLVALAGQTSTVLERQLTTNLSLVKSSINNLSIQEYTCIECAAKMTNDEFSARGRANVKKVAILLTDGGATEHIGSTPPYTEQSYQESSQKALEEIVKGHEDQGIVYYTIGFGSDANEEFLQAVADQTGGKYFFAPTANELSGVFSEISTIIGKGSVSGSVFNDGNENGTKEDFETQEAGWTINVYDSSSAIVQTTTTNTEGNYEVDGLCDGSYLVEASSRQGWKKTFPTEQGHNVTITSGASVTDQNFGFFQEPLYCPISKAVCKWDPAEDVTEYTVTVNEISDTGQQPIQIVSQTIIPPTSQIIFDAEPGKKYECIVVASNSCGVSPQAKAEASCPVNPTDTPTPSPTLPPGVTPSDTPTPTITPTLPPEVTPSDTPTPTITPSETPTPTPIPTGTPVPTSPPNNPPSVIATDTPVPTPTTEEEVPTVAPTNTPIPTIAQATSTPRPTVAPTGSGAALGVVGITAAALAVIGALFFLVF